MSDQPIYPWYAAVKGDAFEQGDVLPGFEIVVPKAGSVRAPSRSISIGKAWQPSASRPPYREHLAQAFARFFMRVGLPIDIPEERIHAKPKT